MYVLYRNKHQQFAMMGQKDNEFTFKINQWLVLLSVGLRF